MYLPFVSAISRTRRARLPAQSIYAMTPAKHLLVLAAFGLVAAGVPAQPLPPVPTLTVQFEAQTAASADLRGRPGDMSLTRGEARLRYAGPLRGGPDGFGFELGYSAYDFGFRGIAKPFADLRSVGLGGLYKRDLGSDWAWFTTAEVGFGAEHGARLADGTTVQVRTGAEWRVRPALAVGVWVFASSRLENSTRVIPALGLQWQATPRLTVVTFNGVRAVYALDAKRRDTLDFSVTYESEQFRLRDRPMAADRALEFAQVPLAVGFTRRFADGGPTLRVYAHSALWTQFDLRQAGARADRFRADPTWGGGASVSWAF